MRPSLVMRCSSFKCVIKMNVIILLITCSQSIVNKITSCLQLFTIQN